MRHAQDKADKLTRYGRKQAKNIVKELYYENIDVIYTSPMGRTVSTAKIIARGLNIEHINIDERITERDTNVSCLSPVELDTYNNNYLNPHYSHVNPEGCKEFVDRIANFLDDIIHNNDVSSNILVVGHSSMSYIMYAYFAGTHRDKIVWTRLGNASKIAFDVMEK